VNISPQTKCPLNILPQVTFCPSDIWTFMGWIVRPLFTPSFLPWKWYAQSQCDISSLFIMASPNLVTFCLSDTVSPPYDSSTQVWHDVHPITCHPSCDIMSSLWHFFLTGTLYLFWYSLSTLNIYPFCYIFTSVILWPSCDILSIFQSCITIDPSIQRILRDIVGNRGFGWGEHVVIWCMGWWGLFSVWQFIYVWHVVHHVTCSPHCDILSSGNILPLRSHVVHSVTFCPLVTFCPFCVILSICGRFAIQCIFPLLKYVQLAILMNYKQNNTSIQRT
jgi:hypothetical protein